MSESSVAEAPKKARNGKIIMGEGLTSEETQIIHEAMEYSTNWSLKEISNMIFTRCKRRVSSKAVKDEWFKVVKDFQKPTEQQVAEYFYKLFSKNWFDYTRTALLISQGPFKTVRFGKQFLQKVYRKTLGHLQILADSVFQGRESERNLTKNEKARLAQFLVTSQCRFSYLIQPEMLRYYLLKIYLLNLRGQSINRKTIQCGHYHLQRMKKQGFLCDRSTYQFGAKWSYCWEQFQLQRLFCLYCEYGEGPRLISRIMIQEFGQKQKYNATIIRSVYQKLQRNALVLSRQMLKREGLKMTGFTFNATLENGAHLVLKKGHQHFEDSIKIMAIAFGQVYEPQEIGRLCAVVADILKDVVFWRKGRKSMCRYKQTM